MHPLSNLNIFLKRLEEYEKDFKDIRCYLSLNPNLTAEMVLKDLELHPNLPTNIGWWDYWCLMRHKNIKLEAIFHIIPERIKQYIYCNNFHINLTINTLIKYRCQDWGWCGVTKHNNITIEDIVNHPELPWDYNFISKNPNLRLYHLEKYPHFPWNEFDVYQTVSATASFQEIISRMDKPWSMQKILTNPNHSKAELEELILFIFITKNVVYYCQNTMVLNILQIPTIKDCWEYLCLNRSLTFADLYDMYLLLNKRLRYLITEVSWLEEVKKHFPDQLIFTGYMVNTTPIHEYDSFVDAKHAFQNMSYNETITGEDIEIHKDKPWNFLRVSHNIKDIEYVFEHPEFSWDYWTLFSRNKHMTKELAIKYNTTSQFNYAVVWYCANPVATAADINELITNKLVSKKDQYIYVSKSDFLEPSWKEIREYFAKKKIIRILTEINANPDYLWCRKRLAREHLGLL